ncbi:hypothetical protein [Bradyrhizobium sp. SZCCHNRI1003]|uniref:hypothetical protein n=1 Tax=Bradyrhizobium sp. SZCCHNRI1003 TaxID=3057275 RepID=UPI0029164344|nr:hypothetical protein [Bradyrhizobium sp. SZCCHNRI1003]
MKRPKFSQADGERASDEWGCNCGPGAIAAIMLLTLDEVRPHMGDFERKRYTNPTLMFETLDRLRAAGVCRSWRVGPKLWPAYGLVRIQWEGPWMEPGVPMRARYRHTHWVGAATVNDRIGVFDINALNNGSGWSRVEDWSTILVPWLIKECVPRGNGKWQITHAIDVVLPEGAS